MRALRDAWSLAESVLVESVWEALAGGHLLLSGSCRVFSHETGLMPGRMSSVPGIAFTSFLVGEFQTPHADRTRDLLLFGSTDSGDDDANTRFTLQSTS